MASAGCGKSTVLRLIMRLYDVSSGSILLNSINVREVCRVKLPQQVPEVSDGEHADIDADLSPHCRLCSACHTCRRPAAHAPDCALQLTHAAVKGAVAAVPQYVNLVDRSVAANIAFGLCVFFCHY